MTQIPSEKNTGFKHYTGDITGKKGNT